MYTNRAEVTPLQKVISMLDGMLAKGKKDIMLYYIILYCVILYYSMT